MFSEVVIVVLYNIYSYTLKTEDVIVQEEVLHVQNVSIMHMAEVT